MSMHDDFPAAPAVSGQHYPPPPVLPGDTINGAPGSFSLEFVLGNRGMTNSRRLTGVVDTRRFRSVVPAAILEELGIARERTERFIQPDGAEGERDIGFAELELDGKRGFDHIVFGPDPDCIIIGRMTLSHLALAADAGQKCLIPGTVYLPSAIPVEEE